MNHQDLLANLENFFQTSNQAHSQQIFLKIVDLATKKLKNTRSDLSIHRSKMHPYRIKLKRHLKKRIARKAKFKMISKQKLKQTAMKIISHQNKLIHHKWISNLEQHNKHTQKREAFFKNYSIHKDESQQQQQKLQENSQQMLEKLQKYTKSNNQQKKQHPKMQIIKKMKSGKNLVEEKFLKTRKNFQTYLKSNSKQPKIQDITCPVCIDVLIDPVSTLCGHSFCFKCLDESLLFGTNCPVCRLLIKGLEIVPCEHLKKLIKIKCDQFKDDQQTLETYRLRIQQRNQWRKQRFIDVNSLKEGLILDVRDTQNIWCKAKIIKIYYINKKVTSILIHYLQWAKLYDEVIDIKSTRLAPKDYFSSRNDLPRYNLNLEEQNLRGAVVTGHAQNPPRRNELGFANIIELDNLRLSINSLRNNLRQNSNPQIQLMQRIMQPGEVNYMHRVIQFDQDESSQQSIDQMNSQNIYQGVQNSQSLESASENEQYEIVPQSQSNELSLASLLFMPEPQELQEAEENQEYFSGHNFYEAMEEEQVENYQSDQSEGIQYVNIHEVPQNENSQQSYAQNNCENVSQRSDMNN